MGTMKAEPDDQPPPSTSSSGVLSSGGGRVKEGELVILYAGYSNVSALVPRRGQQHQSQFGALRHEFVIGQV